MEILKKATLLTLLITLSVGGFSQNYKVKESSSRKAPSWYGAMEQGYIITEAITDDLESAKKSCINDVKKMIIDAVAQNVKSSSETNMEQEVVNNQITSFMDEFSYSLKTESANIPYINSVSYSNVEDYYWEKRVDRKSDDVKYLYTIKYPFSSLELKKLVNAFNEQDQMMEGKLTELESAYNDISSVEQVGGALKDLKPLQKYFFDDVRRSKTTALVEKYSSVYGSLSIKRVSDELGKETFGIMYGDKLLTYSTPLKVKSNSAFEIEKQKHGDLWVVSYNYSTCYPEEINFLDISWIIAGRTVKERFNIKLDKGITGIKAVGDIDLVVKKNGANTILSIDLHMDIESTNNDQYTIQSIRIDSDEFITDLLFSDINHTISSKGIHRIKSTNREQVEFSTNKKMRVPLTKGVITFTGKDKSIKTMRFTLPINKQW